jgi:hypothetical protein
VPYATPLPARMYTCAWCGGKKLIHEMRNPESSRGKTPSTCYACREGNPDLGWCDFHAASHPIARFRPHGRGRPGFQNECLDALALKAARARNKPPRSCPACQTVQESWFFRGGQSKSATCRSCSDEHPGERWCVGCPGWFPHSEFAQTKDGLFNASRCRMCRAAYAHGMTVAEILEIQGSTVLECAACGSCEDLNVDHDHACCPAARGCRYCVRGYLCHDCNTAEGLLKTPDRALKLAAYMNRFTTA